MTLTDLQTAIEGLNPYQIDQVAAQVTKYMKLNDELKQTRPDSRAISETDFSGFAFMYDLISFSKEGRPFPRLLLTRRGYGILRRIVLQRLTSTVRYQHLMKTTLPILT